MLVVFMNSHSTVPNAYVIVMYHWQCSLLAGYQFDSEARARQLLRLAVGCQTPTHTAYICSLHPLYFQVSFV